MGTAWHGLGRLLFRARSFSPLPVAGVVAWLSWGSHVRPGPGGAEVDATLNVVGLGLCLAGSAVRLLTVASVPTGTSLQSRRMQAAAGLNTSGPYAVVRHPLYLGNALIVLGLLAIAHAPWAWAIGGPWFAVTTAAIVSAEERLLASTWGEAFERWRAEVPAFLPRLSALGGLRGPFAWRRAVQREVNPLVAWGCGATLLLTWEWFARTELTTALGQRCVAALGLLLALLALNKGWKLRRPARD